MSNKILSIVIPTYNMQKYLSVCLDSLIYEKDGDLLEVIVVNDGSKDESLNIALEYQKKYPNIFKVIDKENGGHGSTINAGLKVACGKYFKVIDSDDWVDTSELIKLLNYLKDSDVDCVMANYTSVYEISKKTVLNDVCADREVYKIYKIEDVLKISDFLMASITFKTSLIKEINIREKCFYVDIEYDICGFAKCKTIVFVPFNIYYYRLGRIGQSVSTEGRFKHRKDHTLVIKDMVEFLLDDKYDKDILKEFIIDKICHQYYNYIVVYNFDKANTLNEIIEFDKWLNQKDLEIYNKTNKNRYVKMLRKSKFKKLKLFNLLWRLRHVFDKK